MTQLATFRWLGEGIQMAGVPRAQPPPPVQNQPSTVGGQKCNSKTKPPSQSWLYAFSRIRLYVDFTSAVSNGGRPTKSVYLSSDGRPGRRRVG